MRSTFASLLVFACVASLHAMPARERNIRLKEVSVNGRHRDVLHTLGYIREFSKMTSGGDTVFLYREKWVDFMLPSVSVKRFSGWRLPRILSSKSYYHFTNSQGLDSVSDRFNQHFSWSDWLQMPNKAKIPQGICDGNETDTVFGRYRPAEIWRRQADRIDLSVNVLADTTNRRWVPSLRGFFNNDIDFERFDVRYLFKDIDGGMVHERNLDAMTFNIESNGRGRDLFRLSRRNIPYYIETYAEMFIADREYISVKRARELEDSPFCESDLLRLTPGDMSDLEPSILSLIARVENLDTIGIRLHIPTDHNLIGRSLVPLSRKQKIVRRLRGMLGLPLQKYDKSKKVLKDI